MIIARSPLRITLGGGGTDVPSYYRDYEGFLIAAAIDKYVYITIHQTFGAEMIVKYSELEKVTVIDDLKHPIVREAVKMVGLPSLALEITSMADIPAGTGLGSSGSFTTALLKALYAHNKHLMHPLELAERACEIEIDRPHARTLGTQETAVQWNVEPADRRMVCTGDEERCRRRQLIGAGGGGFLMFYAENKTRLRHAMTQAGLNEVRFRFDFEGTKIIVS